MLNTTTTLSIQGTSKDPVTQQDILTYNDNKAAADADYDKFEAYANAIFDKVSAGVSATEEA